MQKQTPEEVVDLLPPDMQYTLGSMAEWDDESLIGYSLDNLPFGTRSLLQAYEAIEESNGSGWALRFTKFGRKIAQACFEKHEGYIRYKLSELEEAKARRAAGKLTEKLQRTLAVLAGATDHDIELTLVLLPRAEKIQLQEIGAVELDEQDEIVFVRITEAGRRVMNACSYLQGPDWMKQDCDQFERERREYWETRFRNPSRVRVVSSRRRK